MFESAGISAKRFLPIAPSLVAIVLFNAGCAPLTERPASDSSPQPLVCEDALTHTIYYVETDRRHVSAIQNGNLLWTRDLCTSGGRDGDNLGRIDHIGPVLAGDSSGYVEVSFNTGDFGRFNKSTGIFIYKGCD